MFLGARIRFGWQTIVYNAVTLFKLLGQIEQGNCIHKFEIVKFSLCLQYRENDNILSYLMCSSTARQNGGKMVSKIRGPSSLIKLQMKFTKKRNVPVYLWNEFVLETLHFNVTTQTTTKFSCKRRSGFPTSDFSRGFCEE